MVKCVKIEISLVLFSSEVLMCPQSRVKEVEEENSELQLRLKKLNEEFRTRLVCYLQDLAVSTNNNQTNIQMHLNKLKCCGKVHFFKQIQKVKRSCFLQSGLCSMLQ